MVLVASDDATNTIRVSVLCLLINSKGRGPDEGIAHEWCKAATHEASQAFGLVDVFDASDKVSVLFRLHAGLNGI